MLDVSTINSPDSFSALTQTDKLLGKDDFLKLLVTQLRYQDPINPMENTEFVAQLAQFSSLEQMQNIDDGIQGLALLTRSVNNSLTTELIGKDIKFSGNSIQLSDEDDVNIYYKLANDAEVKIQIYNNADQLVATLEPGKQSTGDQMYAWNGTGSDGKRLAAGNYHFQITALDSAGKTVPTNSYAVDRVKGIKFENGTPILMLSDREVYLSEILEILKS